MKRISLLLILLTTICITAFAANRDSGTVSFDSAVRVGSTELPAGNYKVTWTGPSDNAQVTLKQGKTTAITAAHVVEARHNVDAFATKTENGARVVTEIQFRDTTLMLQPSPSQTAGR